MKIAPSPSPCAAFSLVCLKILFIVTLLSGCVSEKRIVKIIEKHEANKRALFSGLHGNRLKRDTIRVSISNAPGPYIEYDSIMRTTIPILLIKNK